jgi:hypothetical protein
VKCYRSTGNAYLANPPKSDPDIPTSFQYFPRFVDVVIDPISKTITYKYHRPEDRFLFEIHQEEKSTRFARSGFLNNEKYSFTSELNALVYKPTSTTITHVNNRYVTLYQRHFTVYSQSDYSIFKTTRVDPNEDFCNVVESSTLYELCISRQIYEELCNLRRGISFKTVTIHVEDKEMILSSKDDRYNNKHRVYLDRYRQQPLPNLTRAFSGQYFVKIIEAFFASTARSITAKLYMSEKCLIAKDLKMSYVLFSIHQ